MGVENHTHRKSFMHTYITAVVTESVMLTVEAVVRNVATGIKISVLPGIS